MRLVTIAAIASTLLVSAAAIAQEGPEGHSPAQIASYPELEGHTQAQIASYAEPEGHAPAQVASYAEPEGHTPPQIA
jgi:hypothetical protein